MITYKLVAYGCIDVDGVLQAFAPYEQACHEHINDGINDYQLDDMANWKVVPLFVATED